jgi:uncharacterized protein (TIGR00730 family)
MSFDAEDYLSRHFKTSDTHLADILDTLIHHAVPEGSQNHKLYREMLLTVVRMAQADRSRWDAKILLQTMREMEQAFQRLERFKRRRKVTVFGSARTPKNHAMYDLARTLGAALARCDLMVITGAGGGIMAAAHEGAGLDYSLGLNITLPFEQQANPVVEGSDNLLSFHFFFVRKLFFVKEADALVLCPGGFGTLDEALEVLTLVQTGKSPLVPIVLLDEPGGTYWADLLAFMTRQLTDNHYILASDLRLMRLVSTVEEAVEEITGFYRNFHSSRWLEDRFVMRLQHGLSRDALDYLNLHYRDLCLSGGFEQQGCCASELDEPELQQLPRLSFNFNSRDYGRLRELTDYLNTPAHWFVR